MTKIMICPVCIDKQEHKPYRIKNIQGRTFHYCNTDKMQRLYSRNGNKQTITPYWYHPICNTIVHDNLQLGSSDVWLIGTTSDSYEARLQRRCASINKHI